MSFKILRFTFISCKPNYFRLVLNMLGLILFFFPIMYVFFLVYNFGVNIFYYDEWLLFPEIYKNYESGTLDFNFFWNPHNEHRMPVPKILYLLFGLISNFNTKFFMYLTLFAYLIIVLIFCFYIFKTIAIKKYFIFWIIPITWIIFSPIAYEVFLFGMNIQYTFAIIFSIMSFLFLYKIDSRFHAVFFIFSFIFAMLSSLSIISGISIFIIGIIFLIYNLINDKNIKLVIYSVLWTILSILFIIIYFNGLKITNNGLFNNLNQKIYYFFSYFGNFIIVKNLDLFFLKENLLIPIMPNHLSFIAGIIIILFAFFSIIAALKIKINKYEFLPILIFLFTVFYTIFIAQGRIELGLYTAFTSRYTIFLLVGIAALYINIIILLKYMYKNKLIWTLYFFIMFTILIHNLSAIPYGYKYCNILKNSRELMKFVAINFEKFDDRILKRIWPFSDHVKEVIPYLREKKIGVFKNN